MWQAPCVPEPVCQSMMQILEDGLQSSTTVKPSPVRPTQAIHKVGGPCHTLGATGAGRAVVIENHAKAFSFDSLASNSMKSTNPHSGCRKVGVSKTLDATRPDPAKNQGGIAIVQLAVENHPQDSRVKINEDGVVQTLSGQMGTGGGMFL